MIPKLYTLVILLLLMSHNITGSAIFGRKANSVQSAPSESQGMRQLEEKMNSLRQGLRTAEYYTKEAISLLSVTSLSIRTPKYIFAVSMSAIKPLLSPNKSHSIRSQIMSHITSSIPQLSKLSVIILPKISDTQIEYKICIVFSQIDIIQKLSEFFYSPSFRPIMRSFPCQEFEISVPIINLITTVRPNHFEQSASVSDVDSDDFTIINSSQPQQRRLLSSSTDSVSVSEVNPRMGRPRSLTDPNQYRRNSFDAQPVDKDTVDQLVAPIIEVLLDRLDTPEIALKQGNTSLIYAGTPTKKKGFYAEEGTQRRKTSKRRSKGYSPKEPAMPQMPHVQPPATVNVSVESKGVEECMQYIQWLFVCFVIIGLLLTFCVVACIFAVWSRHNTTKMTDKALKLAFMLRAANMQRTCAVSNAVAVADGISVPNLFNPKLRPVATNMHTASGCNQIQLSAPDIMHSSPLALSSSNVINKFCSPSFRHSNPVSNRKDSGNGSEYVAGDYSGYGGR